MARRLQSSAAEPQESVQDELANAVLLSQGPRRGICWEQKLQHGVSLLRDATARRRGVLDLKLFFKDVCQDLPQLSGGTQRTAGEAGTQDTRDVA